MTTAIEPTQERSLDRLGEWMIDHLGNAIEKGVGPITGAQVYADSRLEITSGDIEKAIKRIISETTALTATNGFVTGVGGVLTLPVTLPANLAGQAVLNARMVAAIAYLRGWDIRDEVVLSAVMITATGGSADSVLQGFGVELSKKVAQQAIKRLPIEIVRAVNKKAGFMLVAKYGTKRSVVTLAKFVPGVGGLVGAGFDATLTRAVAKGAKKAFPAT